MQKFERKEALLRQLQKKALPLRLMKLANEYGCSVKTIRRDIEELVTERSAPWFILNGEVYLDLARQTQIELEGYWFTSEELFSLLALYSIVDELAEGLLAGHFLEIKKRILNLLGPNDEGQTLIQNLKIIPIAQPTVKSSSLNKITAAISHQQRLLIKFWNRHTNQVTLREVSPYQLVRYRDRWFLDGHCHQQNALRSFSLEAMIELTHLPQKILPSDFQALQNYFQSSYGIFSGQADKFAILNFSPYQARWVKDQQWHPKQTAKWLEDGRYQLTLPYKEDLELIQDVLKYGPEVEVISPPELREKVRDKLKATLKVYE
ncbi:MAG: WYL domain-containing protein [Thiotrichales bacterium]|nr:WYL domain-containing protein [Thiotrichales bacterium]